MSNDSSSAPGMLRNYSVYLRQGENPSAPNYLLLRASPAMLCLTRTAQPARYIPPSGKKIAFFAQPKDYSLRPPTYVSDQAVMDLYRLLGNHYGVSPDDTRNGTKRRKIQVDGETSAVSSDAVPTPHGASASSCKNKDYRLELMKQNSRHIDNRLYHKRVCKFFNAKGGCFQGDACKYLHENPSEKKL